MGRDFNCMLMRVRPYLAYIRPLEVRPLNHPERVRKPWGFCVSANFAVSIAEAKND